MKRKITMPAVAIALAAGGFQGTAPAGTVNEADPDGAFIQSWVSHEATETGSPAESGAPPERSGNDSRSPVVNLGGVECRAIDIGPGPVIPPRQQPAPVEIPALVPLPPDLSGVRIRSGSALRGSRSTGISPGSPRGTSARR